MEICALYSLEQMQYLVAGSFMWVSLLCLMNFYLRSSFIWFLAGTFYWLLVLNGIWHFNVTIGKWLISVKPEWFASIDSILPGILIYQSIATWIMFLFCVLLFLVLVIILAQLGTRIVCFVLGVGGLIIYFIAFAWWIYWVLSINVTMPLEVIIKFKNLLLFVANIFFILAFTFSLKKWDEKLT